MTLYFLIHKRSLTPPPTANSKIHKYINTSKKGDKALTHCNSDIDTSCYPCAEWLLDIDWELIVHLLKSKQLVLIETNRNDETCYIKHIVLTDYLMCNILKYTLLFKFFQQSSKYTSEKFKTILTAIAGEPDSIESITALFCERPTDLKNFLGTRELKVEIYVYLEYKSRSIAITTLKVGIMYCTSKLCDLHLPPELDLNLELSIKYSDIKCISLNLTQRESQEGNSACVSPLISLNDINLESSYCHIVATSQSLNSTILTSYNSVMTIEEIPSQQQPPQVYNTLAQATAVLLASSATGETLCMPARNQTRWISKQRTFKGVATIYVSTEDFSRYPKVSELHNTLLPSGFLIGSIIEYGGPHSLLNVEEGSVNLKEGGIKISILPEESYMNLEFSRLVHITPTASVFTDISKGVLDSSGGYKLSRASVAICTLALKEKLKDLSRELQQILPEGLSTCHVTLSVPDPVLLALSDHTLYSVSALDLSFDKLSIFLN